MADRFEIHSVTFLPEGVAIQYNQLPTDVRVDGKVMLAHEARLHASHPDYREDIEGLLRKAERTLKNALDDFNASEPFEPEPDDDDDSDLGMGEKR